MASDSCSLKSSSSAESPLTTTPSTSKGEEESTNLVESQNIKISTDAAVDPVLHETLISMGMDKNLSRKALICTKNKSIDVALQWIAELGAEEMEALCHDNEACSDCSSDWEDCEEEVYYKMVFVVNMEYGMGVGKVASQVAHAALGLYRVLKEDREKYQNSLDEWECTGEKKISVKGQTSAHLLDLRKSAEKSELPTYIVEDAGKTQTPEGALTVLAIFGDEDAVNEVTGHLKLL